MNTGMRHTFGKSNFESQFYRDPINNTIKYKGAQNGYQEIFEGNLITAVDETSLRNKVINGEDLNNICTTLVTSMSSLFFENNSNQNISSWDTSNVVDMKNMFFGNITFNQPIGNWDVSKVIDMQGMFREAYSFYQPIGNWDVRSCQVFIAMFRFHNYNQNLSNWCVEHIASTPSDFGGSFPAGFAPNWGAPC